MQIQVQSSKLHAAIDILATRPMHVVIFKSGEYLFAIFRTPDALLDRVLGRYETARYLKHAESSVWRKGNLELESLKNEAIHKFLNGLADAFPSMEAEAAQHNIAETEEHGVVFSVPHNFTRKDFE